MGVGNVQGFQQALYLEHMGNDLSVVQAAKVSFADDVDMQRFITRAEASLRGERRSHEALIDYLSGHDHWTPFAHTAIKLRMSAPIPIRTQCFKHKQGFVENEESRRYITSRPELFVPDVFRQAPDADKVKQGSAGPHPASEVWRAEYIERCQEMIDFYEALIKDGVAPEQARFVLPQGCIVNWIWTGNLFSFANYCRKRLPSDAQGESRDLALLVAPIIRGLFPYSWAALMGDLE